jgi:hypothetical protein
MRIEIDVRCVSVPSGHHSSTSQCGNILTAPRSLLLQCPFLHDCFSAREVSVPKTMADIKDVSQTSRRTKHHLHKQPGHLLTFREIPSWQKDNEFIQSGYRYSFQFALRIRC